MGNSIDTTIQAREIHTKAVYKCRKDLVESIASNSTSTTPYGLLPDPGGAGGKDASTLTLQNPALREAEISFVLGQFNKASLFLESLEDREQIYHCQGYYSRAAKYCRLGLELIPDPSTPGHNNHANKRFHDLMTVHLLFCTRDEICTTNLPEQCSVVELAQRVRHLWSSVLE